MKIVLVTPDLGGKSGWSRYALDLGRALAARGHEIHCITTERSHVTWGHEYPILRPPTSYLGSVLLCVMDAWKMSRVLRTINPDIIHVIAEPYALMLPFMRTRRWKNILTIHGTYGVVPLRMGTMIRWMASMYYMRMDRIIAVSGFTKNYLALQEPTLWSKAHLEEKTHVIHNAISLAGIGADTVKRPTDRTLSIISVSGVKRKKGYRESLGTIRLFLDRHPIALRYDIIGNYASDPAFTDELRHMITDLRLTDIVTFRGSISDAELDTSYRTADLFLLPSLQEGDYFEGFGLVFIEANARGTPVIGGNTGGCPEAIDHGQSGYVCDPHDAETLVARMEDILLKHTIDRGTCRTWAERHSIDGTVSEIEALYVGR